MPILALSIWPLISAVLFTRLSIALAVISVILAGYLLLPERTALDLPGLPSLDKNSVPAICALVFSGIALRSRRQDPRASRSDTILRGLVPRHPIALALLLSIPVGALATALTNSDPILIGRRYLPGLTMYDAASMLLTSTALIIPLLLGRKYLAAPAEQRLLLVAMCVAGCAYSLLALYEIRMSPQLNRIVYGFFPHSWQQHVRGGGYRPLVFLQHGLWLAIFFAMAILSAFGLLRSGPRYRRALWAGLWLLLTLSLSRSLGALVIALAFLPVILLAGRRAQLILAAVAAGLVLTYPVLRGTQLLPIEEIRQIATDFNEQRGSSLGTRLDNEEMLLERAKLRPAFGWGGWGRPRIYDEYGTDVSITDGYWVIIIGVGGWTRYVGEFGLMAMPIFLLAWRRRDYALGNETAVLAVVLAANMMDALPNAAVTPLTWLITGALWGRVELGARAPENGEVIRPNGGVPARRSRLRRDDGDGEGGAPPVDRSAAAPEGRAQGHLYTRQTTRHRRGKGEPEDNGDQPRR